MADTSLKRNRVPDDPRERREYVKELKRLYAAGELNQEVAPEEVPDRLLELLTPLPLKATAL